MTSEVIEGFNLDIVWLATGALGAAVVAALVLTVPSPAFEMKNSKIKIVGNTPLLRVVCLALFALFFEACSVTEQTPNDVSQKFEEGIKGKGKIVPNDKDPSQTNPSNDSPVTQPAS